ncbi:MAG TPA: hypothetical protein DCX92_01105 [Bacteroidetes bacterium]|nr:hypothetical protein [Bacteroidota bacterium]
MSIFPPKGMRCNCSMLKLVVILSFAITAAVFAQSPDTLYPVKVYVNDKLMYGYINREGEIVIQPKYYSATDFSEGMAFVEIDKLSTLWACINANDEIIFTLNADYFTGAFSEGFASINHNNKYYYVDRRGNNVFNKVFENAKDFNNGLAVVRINTFNKSAVINKSGELVLDTIYRIISNFKIGYVKVYYANNPGIVDTNFNITLLDTSYHFVNTASGNWDIVSSYVPVGIKGKVGYIDLKGRLKINPVFEFGNDFCEGLASVRLGNKWGFIDSTWKFVIEPVFDNAGNFSMGLAPVSISNNNGSYNAFMNRSGVVVIQDTTIYKSKYDDFPRRNEMYWPQPFKNGVCMYYSGLHWDVFERYVRSDGKFIWVKDLIDE